MTLSFVSRELHFKEPAGTSRGVYLTRRLWYVICRDEASDSFGIGECAPLHDLSCDALPAEQYKEVLSQACRRCGELGRVPYEEFRAYPSILFGLETALMSLEADRRTGSPYDLCDTAFCRGEEGIVINGLVWMGSFDEMTRRMEQKLALGFRCIKIKIGAIDWDRELSLIRSLRERFPRHIVELRLDANGAFTPIQAEERLRELAPYDIHSIEQPIRQGQWEAMAHLCRVSPIPIALDEELIGIHTRAERIALLDAIRPDYLVLKPSLHGGLRGSEEWISLARERGIGHWVTSALESNVGLNAIAAWCSQHALTLPQGLGTGGLFTDNYAPIHLEIKGECLWRGNEADRAFQSDLRGLIDAWQSESLTLTAHTSGSTGEPKPIEVEKSRMASSARMTLSALGLRAGQRAMLCMPLRYIAGKMMVVRALVGHLRLQWVPPTSHPLRDLALMGAGIAPPLPDFIALTPMQALATLGEPAERSLFLRIPIILIGGGAISAELETAVQECQGAVFSSYGMTETLSHIALRRLNGPERSATYTPLPGVKVSETAEGCLVIDAPSVCPSRLVTHDLCEILEDGTFRILGRSDNVICSGGIKLSLDDLEQRLGTLAAPYQLTAVSDPLLGEALTMLYVATDTSHPSNTPDTPDSHLRKAPLSPPDWGEVAAQVTERLERYERPRHYIAVESLPTTETGKPARAAARQLAAKLHTH